MSIRNVGKFSEIILYENEMLQGYLGKSNVVLKGPIIYCRRKPHITPRPLKLRTAYKVSAVSSICIGF